MLYLKVGENNAEKVKRKLLDSMLFDKQRKVDHSSSYVFFPVYNSKPRIKKVIGNLDFELIDRKEQVHVKKLASYRDRLAERLSKKELEMVTKGYDLLGNIAIIDVPDELKSKEKWIAKLLLESHPGVKTVVAKAGAVTGQYRTRKFRHVYGVKTFTAAYKESGCTFVFDIRKAFFSNRLSFERSRINELVKPKENVVVFFAGVGPFAIEIAKSHPKTKVVAVELNKYAIESMRKNIQINKAKNVVPVLGDVRKASSKYKNFADRVIMPMPKQSLLFLDDALRVAKSGAKVHIYSFGKIESAYDDVSRGIMEHAEKKGYKAKVLFKRVVRPYSAKEIEVVLDYSIRK